jgi:hypothetical protein
MVMLVLFAFGSTIVAHFCTQAAQLLRVLFITKFTNLRHKRSRHSAYLGTIAIRLDTLRQFLNMILT